MYYSTATADAGGMACIGRVTGKWMPTDAECAPIIEWEHDDEPMLCSNAAASKANGREQVADVQSGPKYPSVQDWRSSSNNEPLAYGAEPFYSLDGSLYMVYGAREPGDIRIVQLNESSGRLPEVAQPGFTDEGMASPTIYYSVAVGPNFQLGPDLRAPPFQKDACKHALAPRHSTSPQSRLPILTLLRDPFALAQILRVK